MGWTKRDIVIQAFEEVGLASFVFDLDATQISSAVRRLDSMMALWYAKGVRLGYPVAQSANGADPDQDTNLPDHAVMAVYQNLAIMLAPGFGKQVSPDLKASAKASYDVLMYAAAAPVEMQITGLPSGAGHKLTEQPFLPAANTDPLKVSGNDQLIFGD